MQSGLLYITDPLSKRRLSKYTAQLLFSAPEMSIVREQFKDQIPHWICGRPVVQRDWSSLEQTLEGHADGVLSVAFSSDSSRLASGSWDCTVRIWSVATGQIEQVLEGHAGHVVGVSFSPDGSRLASGSGIARRGYGMSPPGKSSR